MSLVSNPCRYDARSAPETTIRPRFDRSTTADLVRAASYPAAEEVTAEDCCASRQLIGHLDDDATWDSRSQPGHRKVTPTWAKWVKGKEYYFHVFANAYTAWQQSVKSPVRPEPTPRGSIGEWLTHAGFGSARDLKTSIRSLPDPDECLAKIYEPKNRQPRRA